ncbi:energy-coupled thiamine transporter ThiT [Paenalkalicoccus suaedae]|uniref:Energy-coupled thiamine transporter ThiT n=1 Tax=Paenalkalicoccus suaedae TaxID=2592382 RepID=A0A859FE63_9BACI|nr:energy-coupled thiamine transporter ThiT [Paenalkalicoccus suaedae]QKS71479.1 energy-coupled thiamine transporter ThiT [Paenalkalicoccus suaedae]
MRQNKRLLIMLEIAIMSGLAYVLDLIPLFQMPQGGSITLSMLPILILAYRRGVIAGIIAGGLFGTLNLMFNSFVVHWAQALLDYPIAFLVIGLAGIFRFSSQASFRKKLTLLIAGVALASALRLLSHFTAGVIWFGSFAPEGMSPVWYSFIYNLSYIAPTFVILVIIMVLFANKGKVVLHPSNGRVA